MKIIDSKTNEEIVEYSIVTENKTAFYKNGKLHKEDGPAIIWKYHVCSRKAEWFLNGKRHRVGGPAIEYQSGWCEYWEFGKYKKSGDL
jgi:hypothetical protein